ARPPSRPHAISHRDARSAIRRGSRPLSAVLRLLRSAPVLALVFSGCTCSSTPPPVPTPTATVQPPATATPVPRPTDTPVPPTTTAEAAPPAQPPAPAAAAP